MVWLSDISPWTMAALGLGWLGVSGVFALALGKVLARTNEAAENEERALAYMHTELAKMSASSSPVDSSDDWLTGVAEGDDEQYAGRAASGTMFKPVVGEGLQTEAHEQSNQGNVAPFRRVR
jgi:hypothetical protein